ncbi:aminopeptidase [Halorubrum sp. CBA1125]|uniref:aminopeptidase n=1 Tax=Halorubrum sp. CBA1125 TaxID=2668072 RepID=UPI0012E8FE60|nr:aminopeptidase [Halorubrum sp. CBA1125]MUW13820.1 aminopeptidase [Halorubrum sp. CBA1125]
MSEESDADDEFLEGVVGDRLRNADELSLTPEQHQRLKDWLHGELFTTLRRAERRYLVVGSGSGERGERRTRVRDRLDRRRNATAFRLEDFGFTSEELDLWAPAFDILSARATHVVGVIEDFDGGHVWELGLLYKQQVAVRDVLWILKRIYRTEAEMRGRYDNGMAASHMAALEESVGEKVLEWETVTELDEAVQEIP